MWKPLSCASTDGARVEAAPCTEVVLATSTAAVMASLKGCLGLIAVVIMVFSHQA